MDHRRILEANRVDLIKTIDIVHTQLWDYLRQYGVVDQETASSIRGDNPVPERQISALLDYISRRPHSCYTNFRRALFQTTQSHVLKDILPPFEFERETGVQTDIVVSDVCVWQQDSRDLQEELASIRLLKQTITGLEKQCQDKDTCITNLKKRIEELEETQGTKDKRVTSLEQTQASNQQRIRDLERHLLEAREEINGLHQATSIKSRAVEALRERLEATSLERAPSPLEPPVRELQLDIKNTWRVAGLTDHRALLATVYPHALVWLGSDDSPAAGPCFSAEAFINAIIPQGDTVLVLERQGRISRCHLDDLSRPTHTWRVDVGQLWGGAALSHHQLVCTDWTRGEVFTCAIGHMSRWWKSTVEKQVKVTGLDRPASVACAGEGDSTVFAVTEYGRHKVHIYNSAWKPQITIGGPGAGDGQLNYPQCCLFVSTSNLLVADMGNDRVTEFIHTGQFVRHVVTAKDGITHPISISFVHPHLWVMMYGEPDNRKVARFKIYQ